MKALIIARSDQVAALRRRFAAEAGVNVCGDSESLQALEGLMSPPPDLVTLHAAFVTTARGAALVARLRSHAGPIEIRVLIEDEEHVPLVLNQSGALSGQTLVQASRPLDRAGTRRATRFPMNRHVIRVNGEPSQLVDLSVTGAQVISPVRLGPGRPVRVTLPDDPGTIRCQGRVAWSVVLPVRGTVQYRGGIEFAAPDADRLADYCARHGGQPDGTFGAA